MDMHTIECLKTHSLLVLNLFFVNSLFKILMNNYDLLDYKGFGPYFLWDLMIHVGNPHTPTGKTTPWQEIYFLESL